MPDLTKSSTFGLRERDAPPQVHQEQLDQLRIPHRFSILGQAQQKGKVLVTYS
jgi:hypothetical protein